MYGLGGLFLCSWSLSESRGQAKDLDYIKGPNDQRSLILKGAFLLYLM